MSRKQLSIHSVTHDKLTEIKEARKKKGELFPSLSTIVHELVEKAHKKECEK